MTTNNKPTNTLRCGNIKESDHLAECRRARSVLLDDFLPPIQGSVRGVANGTSFDLDDLESLRVARKAEEWISAHALKP